MNKYRKIGTTTCTGCNRTYNIYKKELDDNIKGCIKCGCGNELKKWQGKYTYKLEVD